MTAKHTDRGILTKGALGFARAFDIAVVEEEFTAAVFGADFRSPLPPDGAAVCNVNKKYVG